MAIIKTQNEILTLINTFEVEPDKCDELLELLVAATKQAMQGVDGFISASFHRARDRRHIANYAQWESIEKYEAMQQNPEAKEHMQKAAALCTRFTPITYDAVVTEEKSS